MSLLKIIKMLKNRLKQDKTISQKYTLTAQQQLNSDQIHDESKDSGFYVCQRKLLF